jgi:cell wall assembly regulator SMI1
MSKIEELWQEIKDWFFETFPDALDPFLPGASEEEVDKLRLYFPDLPSEFVELLHLNNGERFEVSLHPILGFEILGIERIISCIKTWKRIADDMDEDGNNEIEGEVYPPYTAKRDYINRRYLIFAKDYAGSYLILDLDPDVNGLSGQISYIGAEKKDRYIISKDFESFLSLVVYLNKSGNIVIPSNISSAVGPRWKADDGKILTSILDLLPSFYSQGKIPYQNSSS